MIKRYLNPIDKLIAKQKYAKLVNASNVDKLSKKNIDKIFIGEDKKIRNTYLHNIIDDYIKNEKELTFSFLKKIDRIIKKTQIEISEVERHNLFLLEEQVFSLDRHIKIIEVQLQLYKKEVVGIKFVDARLFSKKSGALTLLKKGTFLISNKRFFFVSDEVYGLRFTKTKEWFINEDGLNIVPIKGDVHIIQIHDATTLANTVENFFGKNKFK